MGIDLKGRHFLALEDYSAEEILHLLRFAARLKEDVYAGRPHPILAGKTLGMIFEKPSLRTMVSFQTGMHQLGGYAVYLGPDQIGLGKRETIEDVARVLSSYVNGIMARTFKHAHVLELAKYSRVPVINGLTDYNHPCQVLADLFTIWEVRGQLAGQRLAYIGDGNNMVHSLAMGCAKLGMHFVCACPPGYEPDADTMARAALFAKKSGGSVAVVLDPREAARGATVLYTDVWASMGQEKEREERKVKFQGFRIDMQLLNLAVGNATVLHCLPAHYDEEIAKDVVDDPRSAVFQQAENRMHAQKALMALTMG